MNCHEVMELMQRQLDEELTEAERELWTAHSKQCPDCTEKLELLKLVSLELTSLPKVTPRFSLVDAIMPELDRLDSLKEQENTSASVPNKVIPMNTKSKKFSWKTFSGVVAAAAVCGIFIATYPFGSDADKSEGALPIVASQFLEGRVAPNGLETPFAASNNPGNNKVGEVGTESYPAENSADRLTKTDAKQHVTAENEDSIKGLSNEEGQMQSSADSDNAENFNKITTHVTGKGVYRNNEELPYSHISMSPNEQFVASVISNSVVVQTASRDDVIIETDRKNGRLMNFKWSEDSNSLTYEVHLDQGAIITYEIDLVQLEEHRAKP